MKTLAAWTPVLLAGLLLITPGAAFAANASFFGPIVPDACNCAGGAGWGCVLLVIGRLINFMISLGVVACVAAIAWAGFLWVMNPLKAEYREQGRGMIMNAIIGLIIALAAWLIVNTFTTVLTGEGVQSWTAKLGVGTTCLPSATDVTGGATVTGYTGTTTTGTGGTASGYTYDPGIQAQLGDESSPLANVLTCMQPKLPDAAKRISSISDSAIRGGGKTFAYCAANGCSHSANSCHYGGTKCVGQSYAADFGNETYASQIIAAAQSCGAKTLMEGDHVHVSIGDVSGCGCTL